MSNKYGKKYDISLWIVEEWKYKVAENTDLGLCVVYEALHVVVLYHSLSLDMWGIPSIHIVGLWWERVQATVESHVLWQPCVSAHLSTVDVGSDAGL